MDKFEKRLRKLSKHANNAVVVGKAFGTLEKILSIYKTTFVIGVDTPPIKAKNLVYRENFQNLNSITEIGAIFFDRDTILHLDSLKDLWQRNNAVVIIEGNDPIERTFSKSLYDTGWGCTSLQGLFHVWEKIK